MGAMDEASATKDAEAGTTAGPDVAGGGSGLALDPEETTVHEALRRVPGADEVFGRFGLDCCCGGERPVATAAERPGVELARLLEALRRAAARG